MGANFDIEAVRREFPVTRQMLYFDTAHQSPLSVSVKAALERFYNEGLESAGPKPKWLERVEKVRARVASFIGADVSEIAFTKNTSEGLNIAANALPFKAGDNVLLIEGDHPNNAYAFLNLASKGLNVRFVPMWPRMNAESFAPHIDERTCAISLSHVTFHSGQVFDIADIGKLCAERGIPLVVDAMQSVGVVSLDVSKMPTAMVVFGCHKGLLVPQGLGVLCASKNLSDLKPAYMAVASLAHPPADLVARADNMELKPGARRFEIGNYNIPDIHALDASLDLIERIGRASIFQHVLDLGAHMLAHLDELGMDVVGPRARDERCHIMVLKLPPAEWVPYLRGENVRVSPERDGVRVSFGMFNTTEEIDRFARILKRGKAAIGTGSTKLLN